MAPTFCLERYWSHLRSNSRQRPPSPPQDCSIQHWSKAEAEESPSFWGFHCGSSDHWWHRNYPLPVQQYRLHCKKKKITTDGNKPETENTYLPCNYHIKEYRSPVQKFMLYGFQMDKGEVILYKFEKLHLALVLRMIDNKQVDCVICGMIRNKKNVQTKLQISESKNMEDLEKRKLSSYNRETCKKCNYDTL